MTFRNLYVAAALAVASIVPAQAQTVSPATEVAPARAHRIDLGALKGVAYYTVENAGFRVVATLGEENGQPVRLETLLVPGQSVVLTSPAEQGAVPARVEISRQADDLRVQPVAATH